MTLRTKLLAAGAAVALPAAMASAQETTPPTPPADSSVPTPPATTPPVADTEDRATQAADETTRRAEEAADEVEADAEADIEAQTQALTTPPTQPPAQSQAPAEAQTQTQAQTSAQAGPVSAASQTDLTAGAMVHDQQGGMVGTIESADATGAVVSTGTVRARLPLSSFGRNAQGLVIAMTRVQLEAAVAAQSPPTPTPGG